MHPNGLQKFKSVKKTNFKYNRSDESQQIVLNHVTGPFKYKI